MRIVLFAALLALLAPTPVNAQPRPFGQVGGWETGAEFLDRQFFGCGAAHPGRSGFMGIALNVVGEWWMVLGFVGVEGERPARLFVDGQPLAARTARSDGYTVSVLLSADDIAALSRGTRLRVELADGRAEWALAGSEAAMAMVSACVARGGG